MPVLCALIALILGFLPAALTFALRKNAADAIGLSQLSVRPWVFIAVWAIIYPSLGIAAWQIATTSGRSIAIVVPATVLVLGFLQTTAFWFTDSLRSTAVTDATGVVLSVAVVIVLSHTAPAAVPWLVPWVLWMPLTLILKLVALARPRQPTATP